jgi:hypothetical protein
MMALSRNAELYQYLLRLSATLEERDAKQLAEALVHAREPQGRCGRDPGY